LRLFSDRKGQVRVIEAFFSAVLLLSCLTLIPAGINSQAKTDDLASRAENVLLSIDRDGHLASLVDSHDWVSLRDCVESVLPLTLWFNLTVYDPDFNVLNAYPICNGGAVSEKIVSVNYVCASQNSTYAVYVLQLQLAGVD
jgi:hypothetical protein